MGEAERQQIIFENFDWLKDVCRRLPSHYSVIINTTKARFYRTEAEVKESAKQHGTLAQFEECLKSRRRGKRLVVIVGHGGVTYQFV